MLVDSSIALNLYVRVPVPLFAGSKKMHPSESFDVLELYVDFVPAKMGILRMFVGRNDVPLPVTAEIVIDPFDPLVTVTLSPALM